jgi:allantoate deiminase
LVNIQRVLRDIEALRIISEPCEAGTTRIGFTPTYRQGVNYFKDQLSKAGLVVREDLIGNVYGRVEGSVANLPAIVSGSHLDTVRCAGAYDGIAGVVCALEVARMLVENGVSLRHPFEVMGIIEEEGTRFGQVLLGSRFVTGAFGDSELDSIQDADGQSLRSILETYSPDQTVRAYREDNEVLVFLELHDEQGPLLQAENTDIGIVESIVAISWLTVSVVGFSGHAGTVPMPLRQDAATAACRLIDAISRFTTEHYAYRATATVGKIELKPGSTNCIPGHCVFTIDLRAGELETIDALITFIRKKAEEVAQDCQVEIRMDVDSRIAPIVLDKNLRDLIQTSCEQLGYSYRVMNSGAGHDAMVFAARWPAAMLFVPCDKGITHNPAEYISPDALRKGTEVLYRTILALDEK